ncbi:MAG: hypothetical protein Q4C30_04705 [Bacteroidia bacterium]|nr:hypothetical protein [Bacteroidia bacterium]
MEFIFQFFAQLFSESELMGSVDNEVLNACESANVEQEVMQAKESEQSSEELVNIFEMVNFH